MNKSFAKNAILALVFTLTLSFAGAACAQIETSVEPFTGEQTYTSKYTFSDAQHNMHSIALIKKYKAVPGKPAEVQTYFLLNFTLERGNTLGDAMIVQVSPRYVNEIPLTPYIISGIGYSSVPTSRTGPKQLPPMTLAAIEKGEALAVKVNFLKGSGTYTIPAEAVKEWADLLKLATAPAAQQPAQPAAVPDKRAEGEKQQTQPAK